MLTSLEHRIFILEKKNTYLTINFDISSLFSSLVWVHIVGEVVGGEGVL